MIVQDYLNDHLTRGDATPNPSPRTGALPVESGWERGALVRRAGRAAAYQRPLPGFMSSAASRMSNASRILASTAGSM